MYNRRLLLLGSVILFATFILTSGWAYPSGPVSFEANDHVSNYDTSRDVNHALAPAVTTSPSEIAFGQLYLATTIGGSNGDRLNPKALSFVQDYMKDKWEELQSIRSYGQAY